MPATNYANNNFLNYNFGRVTTGSPPTTWYLGLSTTAITGSGIVTEISGSGYARQAITNDKTKWTTALSGSLTNSGSVEFTATGAWGNILYAFLSDHLTSGSVWYYYQLNPSLSIQAATTIPVEIGSIIVNKT